MGRAFEYRRAAKEARWDKMSKVFPKLAKAITVAAKEGGTEPDMNPKLRAAIAAAKAQNMPKDKWRSSKEACSDFPHTRLRQSIRRERATCFTALFSQAILKA